MKVFNSFHANFRSKQLSERDKQIINLSSQTFSFVFLKWIMLAPYLYTFYSVS